MEKLLKIGTLAFLGVALVLSTTSCSDDDPDYNNVTPPVVAQVHNISGSIAGMDGNGIEGATVSISGTANATATTDKNGYFVFEDVAVGTYDMKATASGKLPKETSVNVTEDGQGKNVVWNVMLASEASVTDIAVNADGGEGNVTTEALQGNEKAEILVEVAVSSSVLKQRSDYPSIPHLFRSRSRTESCGLQIPDKGFFKYSCRRSQIELSRQHGQNRTCYRLDV